MQFEMQKCASVCWGWMLTRTVVPLMTYASIQEEDLGKRDAGK